MHQMPSYLKVLLVIIVSSLSAVATAWSQTGIIQGMVRDESTNKPVSFANVRVVGTTVGSMTDDAGKFEISEVPAGFRRIEVNFVGYEQYTSSEIQVVGNQTSYIEIKLKPTEYMLGEVVVATRGNFKKVDSPVSLIKLEVSQIEKSAGVNRDVSKLVQTLPGVASTSAQRNDLIVRGGGPSENVFYLDEIELPIINHFSTQGSSGGVVGIVNPDFVQDLDFYSGAYPANRPNALSSVMEITQKEGRKDRVHTKFSVGASDASITLDGPAGSRGSFILSARQSYLQLLFSLLKLPFLPQYNDFQAKYKLRIDDRNELNFVGIGAIDLMKLNTGISDPDVSQKYVLAYLPAFDQWSYATGVVYKHYGNHYSDTWVLSRNMLRNVKYKYEDNDESKPKTLDYKSDEIENKVRWERSFQGLPFRALTGLGATYAKYSNQTTTRVIRQGAVTPLSYSSKMDNVSYNLFGQISDDFLDQRLTLSAGITLEGNNCTKYQSNPLHQISPRASISYDLLSGWSVSANVGRYHKRTPYITKGFMDGEGRMVNKREDIRYTVMNQYVTGIKYVGEDLQVTLEGFYKDYDRYPISADTGISLASSGTEYGQVGDEKVITEGKGRAYGSELYVKYRPAELPLRLTMTYTLFRSEFTGKDGVYRPSSWDARHMLNLMGGYEMGRGWNISGRWRLMGGAPYTPIDYELSANKEIWDVTGRPIPDYKNFNTLRLPASHQLDLRLDKEFFFKAWALNLYVDVQNVYNFKTPSAPLYTNLNESGLPSTDPTNPDAYKLSNVTLNSGTILPTLGIIVSL